MATVLNLKPRCRSFRRSILLSIPEKTRASQAIVQGSWIKQDKNRALQREVRFCVRRYKGLGTEPLEVLANNRTSFLTDISSWVASLLRYSITALPAHH